MDVNNRIMVYDPIPTDSGPDAVHVIGQSSPDVMVTACSATRLQGPYSATIAAGKLIVADTFNNRVLIWNVVPARVDTPADIVLGQDSMRNCRQNDDEQTGVPPDVITSRTLFAPYDVWSDGQRLAVADTSNNRVLIWNEIPEDNFVPANIVLGQAGFSTSTASSAADGMHYPYSIHSNGNQLFVADFSNNRILVWNSFPTENGQPADTVIGQANLTSGSNNAGNPGPNNSGFFRVSSVYVHGNQLFAGDYGNTRYLIFNGTNP